MSRSSAVTCANGSLLSSTDSLGDASPGQSALAIPAGIDRRVAIACFGAAAAVGLVFAFVGLDVHSFWYDELFTARLIEPLAGTTLLSRIATDVHPPVYLVALSVFSHLFGDSDAALRAFSAAAACGAIVIFAVATRTIFSLPARLFGAALATGSLFWFVQAQNARSYALCLLISAGIVALGLKVLQGGGPRRALLPALVGLMLIGSFVHFYMMYVGLGVLGMLFLLERSDRKIALAAACGLVLAVGLYAKQVIEVHTQVSLGNNWYPNNPGWYLAVLKSCLRYTFDQQGLAALALCAAAIVYTQGVPSGLRPGRVTAFLIGVPLIVVAGGIASSLLMAPNFFDRNVLVVSPFLWALAARAYDAAVEKASPSVRLALACALGFIALSMTSIVASRLPSGEAPAQYEPYRPSAQWIQTLPECRGQMLPVVTTDSPDWYKPGYAAFIHEAGYARYLQGFATPRLLFSRDLSAEGLTADLKSELQHRLDGTGCPVIAWAAHNMSPGIIANIEQRLLMALDRRGATLVATQRFDDGSPGFVLYVRR